MWLSHVTLDDFIKHRLQSEAQFDKVITVLVSEERLHFRYKNFYKAFFIIIKEQRI
ncbi:hypothetical protein BD560DRAFT_409219, partial [Blakeslea trispora]